MKWLKTICIASFFLFLLSITFTTSTDFNQDLGRHLKLGEIISKTFSVPHTNLFSFTHPNFPFINHHWLSEVFFYQLVLRMGTSALIYLKVVLFIIATIIILKFTLTKNRFIPTLLSVLLFSPLLIERSDIRPELFGYVLFSLLLYIVLSYKKNSRLIYFVPLIMVLWINLHISFVFGLILLSLFSFKIYRTHSSNKNFIIIFASFLILLLNPNGFRGILFPFEIFRNYGYPIVENQNLFFLNQVTFNPLIKYFFILSPIVIISIIALISINQLIEALLLLVFFVLSVWQIRHFPFFVFTAIPTVSIALNTIVGNGFKQFPTLGKHILANRIKLIIIIIISCVNLFLSWFFITNRFYQIFDIDKRFGLKFAEDGKGAVDYLKNQNLPKNIFSNFDIGGYLIYSLYPRYRLFVDNRPEAYPQQFLTNEYIKLQQDTNLREKIFKKYNINTIYFSLSDQTPWATQFIQTILEEKRWRLVYLDPRIMILSTKIELTDIKDNHQYFQNLINKENNYLNLLYLSQFFTLAKKIDLANLAITKSQETNPYSCSIKRFRLQQIQNSPSFYQETELKQNNWWCF